jgi:glycosyltransferase involved in cell wall biosynthesis
MVLLEAMALGKPVIATDVGGVPEAVQHEATGLLVPVDDERAFTRELLRLAADAELVQRLGCAAAKRQRIHFSIEKMTAEYVDLFQEVLEERNG